MTEQELKIIYDESFLNTVAFAYGFTKDQAVATDIVQESFIVLFKTHTDYRKVGPYLKRLVIQRSIDHLRQQKRHSRIEEMLGSASDTEEWVESKIIYAQLLKLLLQELSKMAPDRVKIFRMRFFDDMTNKEIAAALKISVDTVRVQLHRAIVHLKCVFGNRPWVV
jgi:RNA polymerase sigma factor (sigma-70 family)